MPFFVMTDIRFGLHGLARCATLCQHDRTQDKLSNAMYFQKTPIIPITLRFEFPDRIAFVQAMAQLVVERIAKHQSMRIPGHDEIRVASR